MGVWCRIPAFLGSFKNIVPLHSGSGTEPTSLPGVWQDCGFHSGFGKIGALPRKFDRITIGLTALQNIHMRRVEFPLFLQYSRTRDDAPGHPSCGVAPKLAASRACATLANACERFAANPCARALAND